MQLFSILIHVAETQKSKMVLMCPDTKQKKLYEK